MRNPYTATVTANLGANTDALHTLLTTHGENSPIGVCASRILGAIYRLESAERAATDAMTNLRNNTASQADNLTGSGPMFDASWLTHHAGKAAAASADMTAAIETIQTFTHMLGLLTAVKTDA